MSKTLEELFKQIAEKKADPAKPFVAKKYIDYYREGMAAGMDMMYKALGWRRVEDGKYPSDKWIQLRNEHWIGVGKHRPTEEEAEPQWIEETNEYIDTPTHWKYLPDHPGETTTLEKLLQEQLNKKP